ncbi:MAG: hypothetical protein Q9166_001484 [cf. Caloplaca sp. 2 TL-2023]
MAFPPITHPCSPYPSPYLSSTASFSRPRSKRWSRYSQLSDIDEWHGEAIPLVPLSPSSPSNAISSGVEAMGSLPQSRKTRASHSDRSSWASLGGHRWSILSASRASTEDDDEAYQPRTQIRTQIRKRKRWSNSIGSATLSFVGSVRSSWTSFNSHSSSTSSVSVGRDGERDVDDDQLGRQRGTGRKERRLSRVLRGVAMSFGGLAAGGRVPC